MRLLFIDRVERLSRYESIDAVLLLSPNDPIFAIHFPGDPMLPASMLVECFAQAGSILLEASTGFSRKAIPAFLRDAKFRRAVRPSHPVEIRMDVEQMSEEAVLLRGRVTQNGSLSAVCTLGMALAPIDRFYHPENATAYREMYERWLECAVVEGFETDPLAPLRLVLQR